MQASFAAAEQKSTSGRLEVPGRAEFAGVIRLLVAFLGRVSKQSGWHYPLPLASFRLAEGEPMLRHAFVELKLNRDVAVLPAIVVNELVSRIVIGIERLIKVRG